MHHILTLTTATALLAAISVAVACTTSAPEPTAATIPTQIASPTIAPMATVPPSPTPYPTETPFVIRIPEATPTAVPTPSQTPAAPAVPSAGNPAGTATPAPTPNTAPMLTPAVAQTPSPDATPTVPPTQAPAPTATATQTPPPVSTRTLTPTATRTPTPLPTPTPTATPEPNYPPEQAALIALYDGTDGSNWTNNTGWRTDAPIGTWHGVTTDADGSVTHLDLTYNNLSGQLPAAIGQLTELQQLWLSTNQLTGNIPSEIGNLTQLKMLDLSSNQLGGAIPSQLGNLTSLSELLLSYNELSGSIPLELGNMAQMGSMSLEGNQLTGNIPPQLAMMQSLYGLYLGGNMLEGNIPQELTTPPDLVYLDISNNQMSGDTSEWPTNLSKLDQFRISDNNFTGCIPANLRSIRNTDIIYSKLSYCGDPPKQQPVSPDFITWMIGDDVAPSAERAARLSLQWLFDYAISVGWTIARDPVTIYLDNDLGLAQILAESDGTVEPGEIDVHLGFIRSTEGFADDVNNYARAANAGEPVIHSKLVDTIAHEALHTVFQRDLAGYNTTGHGEWSAPLWWTEGMAKLITSIVISNHGSPFTVRRRHLVEAAAVPRCDVPLTDLESTQTYDLFLCAYDVGALAVEFLGSIIGFQNLVNIYTERPEGWGWHQTFEQTFNLSLQDFYTQFTQHRQAGYPTVPHPRTSP